MPTYIVKYSNFKLSKKKEKKIAEDITFTHVKLLNNFFSAIFEKKIKKLPLYGWQRNKKFRNFLNGQIRWTKFRIKKQLILGREIIKKIQNSSTNNIRIYLEDLD